MRFFHLFFPSWRFFENTGTTAVLYFRVSPLQNLEDVPWQETFQKSQRRFLQIFWNAQGNAIYAIQNHANRLIQESTEIDPAELEKTFSFQVLKNYTESLCKKEFYYQFKIAGLRWQGTQQITDDLIASAIFRKINL